MPRLRSALVVISLLLSDLILGLGALGIMFAGVALIVEADWTPIGYVDVLVAGAAPSLALWMMIRLLLGLYPGYRMGGAQELRLQTHSSVVALAAVSAAAFALGMGERFFYLLLPIGAFGLFVMAPVARSAVKYVLRRAGLWGKPVVVLGSGEATFGLARFMLEDRTQDFRPVAIFSNDGCTGEGRGPEGGLYSGDVDQAPAFARATGVDTAVLASEEEGISGLDGLIGWAHTSFGRVVVMTGVVGLSSSTMIAHDLGGVLGLEMKHNLLDPHERRVKRAMDLVITVVGGIFVLPVFLALTLLVWFETRGSIFYKDERMGRGGKTFSCIKFRTMVFDAEDALQRMLEENHEIREEYSKYHKLRHDPRVTRIGRFLRRTSLDELPQLWNVLRGDMSLVGPRPYLPRETGDIGECLQEISRVYPGITGMWQVHGRSLSSFSERVRMDVYYVRNWSIWLDLVILFRTAMTVVFQKGAS